MPCSNWPKTPNQPLFHPFAITPADTDLTEWARAIEASDECTMKLTMADGTVITKTLYRGVNLLPVKRVWLTGSTPAGATFIGWY